MRLSEISMGLFEEFMEYQSNFILEDFAKPDWAHNRKLLLSHALCWIFGDPVMVEKLDLCIKNGDIHKFYNYIWKKYNKFLFDKMNERDKEALEQPFITAVTKEREHWEQMAEKPPKELQQTNASKKVTSSMNKIKEIAQQIIAKYNLSPKEAIYAARSYLNTGKLSMVGVDEEDEDGIANLEEMLKI